MHNIYISLIGGLGNQLFQVALGHALMKISSNNIIYDASRFNKYKDHSLKVNSLFPEKKFINLKNKIFKKRIEERHCGFDDLLIQKIINHSISKDVNVCGYFQSLSYFSLFIPEIRAMIKKRIELLFPELNSMTLKNKLQRTLGIHIRRGDKLSKVNSSIYGNRSTKEIINNIELIFLKGDFARILLIGDDYEYLNNLRSLIKLEAEINLSNDLLDNYCDLLDFYLLANVKSLIISNSTFSLWAGYLSNGEVYYPTPFYPYPRHKINLNHNYEDLIFPDWIPYNVNLDA